MNENAVCLVRFIDTIEESSEEHFGILFDNGFILCLCCGSYIEPEEYKIIEKYHGFKYLDETLKNYY